MQPSVPTKRGCIRISSVGNRVPSLQTKLVFLRDWRDSPIVGASWKKVAPTPAVNGVFGWPQVVKDIVSKVRIVPPPLIHYIFRWTRPSASSEGNFNQPKRSKQKLNRVTTKNVAIHAGSLNRIGRVLQRSKAKGESQMRKRETNSNRVLKKVDGILSPKQSCPGRM